ncbi:MAG: DUF1653 domain-containing protein [Anaerostipes sp.]|nr:DUF1653 domain-containing protein [Anaerostipes sp.]MDD3746628.1 DUF1653 domain-containing protein [Anaerostipes sp.]
MGKERKIPRPGEFYRHRKGKLYQIITIACHSETMESLVIYQGLYDDYKTYARPLSMFLDEKDGEKRFKRVKLRQGSGDDFINETVVEEKKTPKQDILLEFLDAQGIQEKYNVLCSREENISEAALDSIGISMDFVLNSNDREGKIEELKEFLETKIKYESGRR